MTDIITISPICEGDADARRARVEELSRDDRAESVQLLIRALFDSARGVRSAAIAALGAMHNEAVAPALVACLNVKQLAVRNAASNLLIEKQSAAVPALCAALNHEDHDVRKFVVDILGLIEDDSSVPSLLPLLNDSDANVRISVVEALGNLRSASALHDILALTERDAESTVTVIEAMGKIGGEHAEAAICSIIKTQQERYEPDDLIIMTALEALAQCGSSASLHCIDTITTHSSTELSNAATYAKLCIRDRDENCVVDSPSIMQLVSMLHASSEDVIIRAAREIACIGDTEALGTLLTISARTSRIDDEIVALTSQRTDCIECCTSVLESTNIPLSTEQQKVCARALREHALMVMEIDAERGPELFARLAAIRPLLSGEAVLLIEDVLMNIDSEQAMMLDDSMSMGWEE